MKAKKLSDYIQESGKNFISSFRSLDRTIFLVVAYKLVFYFSVFIAYNKYTRLMMEKAEPIFALGVKDFGPESRHLFDSYAQTLQGVYLSFIYYAILFGIVLLFIYTLTNFLAWSAITSTRLKKSMRNFILKFFGLNIIWCVAWAALFILIFTSVKTGVAKYWILGCALLYAHLTTLLYIAYFRRGKMSKAVKSAFNTGFAKLHYFILPYILAGIVFVALNYAIMPLRIFFAENLMTIYFIIFVFYFAWLRIYIYSFAKKLV